MALGAVRLCVLLTVTQGAAAKTVEDLRADLKTRGQRLKEATFRQGGVDSLSQSVTIPTQKELLYFLMLLVTTVFVATSRLRSVL